LTYRCPGTVSSRFAVAGAPKRTFTGGVFQFTEFIFRDEDAKIWKKELAAVLRQNHKTAEQRESEYWQWRTFQISDHLPMWIELKMDLLLATLPFAAVSLVPKKRRKAAP
jgi:hypothetical protein